MGCRWILPRPGRSVSPYRRAARRARGTSSVAVRNDTAVAVTMSVVSGVIPSDGREGSVTSVGLRANRLGDRLVEDVVEPSHRAPTGQTLELRRVGHPSPHVLEPALVGLLVGNPLDTDE